MTDTKQPSEAQGLRDRAAQSAGHAREAVSDTYRAAKTRATRAYDDAADGVEHAFDAARKRVRKAGESAAGSVDTAPLAVLAGGVAVGLVAGLLLPRSRRESELLAPVGARLNETAAAAAGAARTAAREQLDELGLSKDAAKSQVSKLVGGARKAASEVGSAAVAEVRSATGADAKAGDASKATGGSAPSGVKTVGSDTAGNAGGVGASTSSDTGATGGLAQQPGIVTGGTKPGGPTF